MFRKRFTPQHSLSAWEVAQACSAPALSGVAQAVDAVTHRRCQRDLAGTRDLVFRGGFFILLCRRPRAHSFTLGGVWRFRGAHLSTWAHQFWRRAVLMS